MKHRNKPAYWQLYVFTFLMSVILLLLMWAQFPQGWYTIIEYIWAVFVLAGMGAWCWLEREALREEDRQSHKKRSQQLQPQIISPVRTIPLTAVQKHFLDVMDKNRRI
jgi:hypothetical protein